MPLPQADRLSLLDVFLSREDLGTTPLGEGFAIPHVRSPIILGVDRPHVTLSYLDRPVDFRAFDGRPVHTLFTLISPTVRVHLALLSVLASALQDPGFKDCVLRCGTREEILAEARRLDGRRAPQEA
jgi:PTS system nitrogen regulatory IIA component